MQEELAMAFKKSSKVTLSSSPYKVASGLFMALFKAAKVEKEMTKAMAFTHLLTINLSLRKSC